MRITAFILSIYILLLASLPPLGVVEVFPEVLCCISDHNEHQEDGRDGCCEVCNPFLFCQCCPGFAIVVADQIPRLDIDHYCTRNSWIKHLFASELVFSVWHPPRV